MTVTHICAHCGEPATTFVLMREGLCDPDPVRDDSRVVVVRYCSDCIVDLVDPKDRTS
jgi:hypothetical protein